MLGLWALIAVGGAVLWVAANLPPIQSLEIPKRPPSIQIVGNDGTLIASRGEMHGATLTLKDMPPYLPKAFLAIEDRRFYSHFGVDPIGLAARVYANLSRRGVSQGGSTITQQLAKNLFLTQERTLARKLQEVVLALWLEHKFSKTEILELYLNRVYFGSGAYGIDAAALRYFGKSASQVTLAEAAMLAGLIRSPSRLAPNRNPEGAERRAQVVIAAMTEPRRRHRDDGQARARAAGPRRQDRAAPAPPTTSPTGSWTCSTILSAASIRIWWCAPRSTRRCRRPPKKRWSTSWRRRAKSSASARARSSR